MDNKNFISAQVFTKRIAIRPMMANLTSHISERYDRIKKVIELNDGYGVDKIFLVDKGHKDGAELHVVYKSGIIFIFNAITHRFITVLLARKNQIIRLYHECNLRVSYEILKHCDFYVRNNMNI